MKRKIKKVKPIKKFKGCLKMPLNTSMTHQEMLSRSVWYGDWKTKSKTILSKKRVYFINIYITLQNKQQSITTHTTNLIHEHQIKPVLAYIFKNTEIPDDIDWDNSYLTISC